MVALKFRWKHDETQELPIAQLSDMIDRREGL